MLLLVSKVTQNVVYFMERTQIPKFYRVHTGDKDYEKRRVRALSNIELIKLLSLLEIVMLSYRFFD